MSYHNYKNSAGVSREKKYLIIFRLENFASKEKIKGNKKEWNSNLILINFFSTFTSIILTLLNRKEEFINA